MLHVPGMGPWQLKASLSPHETSPHGCGWSQVRLGCDVGARGLSLCPTSPVKGPRPAAGAHPRHS